MSAPPPAALGPGHLRELSRFAAAAAFVESAFYAVLAPMMPALVRELDLGRHGASVLSAAYPAGLVLATVPAGTAASRLGPRRTAQIGIAVLALACLAFALGESPATLVAARFAQGAGAATAWAGALTLVATHVPSERRGAIMGTTFAASFAGSVTGPLLSLLTQHTSRAATFAPVTVVLTVVAAWGGGVREREAAVPADARRSPFTLMRDPGMAMPLVLMGAIGALLGLIQTLGALLLARRGLGDAAIAAVFLSGYGAQIMLTPAIGRLADAHGARAVLVGVFTTACLLFASLAGTWSAGLTAALTAASISTSLVAFTPGALWVSHRAEAGCAPQGLAMAFTNGAFGLGLMLGALLLGGASASAGWALPFLVASALCLAVVALLVRNAVRERLRPAVR